MAILKHVLIAVAATAVSVLAGPLSTDGTATAIVNAPQPAVTEVSKPLEGKELEDYLANGPHIPEGSIDITNTTLATELMKFREAHGNETALAKRSGACHQGKCPDFNAGFDLFEQHWVVPVWGSAAVYWTYSGRWNDCGQCGEVPTSKGGCFDFTSCGRKQNICIDYKKARAHRIWKDNGHKTCYKIDRAFIGGCGVLAEATIDHPVGEVPCTW